jgi:hypothetical protein
LAGVCFWPQSGHAARLAALPCCPAWPSSTQTLPLALRPTLPPPLLPFSACRQVDGPLHHRLPTDRLPGQQCHPRHRGRHIHEGEQLPLPASRPPARPPACLPDALLACAAAQAALSAGFPTSHLAAHGLPPSSASSTPLLAGPQPVLQPWLNHDSPAVYHHIWMHPAGAQPGEDVAQSGLTHRTAHSATLHSSPAS